MTGSGRAWAQASSAEGVSRVAVRSATVSSSRLIRSGVDRAWGDLTMSVSLSGWPKRTLWATGLIVTEGHGGGVPVPVPPAGATARWGPPAGGAGTARRAPRCSGVDLLGCATPGDLDFAGLGFLGDGNAQGQHPGVVAGLDVVGVEGLGDRSDPGEVNPPNAQTVLRYADQRDATTDAEIRS
jgi:hypothetical protein